MADKPFRSLDDGLDWLYSSTNYEQKKIVRYNVRAFNLDRARAILASLGDPHLAYPTLHVAGTKGKGSTCAMTAAIVKEAGLGRVGLYTSPHLMDMRERISVNFEWISEGALLECLCRIKRPVEEVAASGPHMRPTFFEIFTVLAFLHFRQEKVNAAVVEVGLGGRLDATNLVEPVVTGITPISFDHTGVLGTTLREIAGEKAGIIKPRVPLVVGAQAGESFAAIERAARRSGAPLVAYGRDFLLYERSPRDFEVRTAGRTYDGLSLPLLGPHQRRNAAMAILLAETACDSIGIRLTAAAVRRALSNLRWGGRVELFSSTPPVVIDAAHNAASARALAEAIRETFPAEKAVILIGIAAHKDTKGVIDSIAPIASRFVATTIDSPRSESAAGLARRIRSKCSLPVDVVPNRKKALERAQRLAGDGLLVITGSFYLAGELRGLLQSQTTG